MLEDEASVDDCDENTVDCRRGRRIHGDEEDNDLFKLRLAPRKTKTTWSSYSSVLDDTRKTMITTRQDADINKNIQDDSRLADRRETQSSSPTTSLRVSGGSCRKGVNITLRVFPSGENQDVAGPHYEIKVNKPRKAADAPFRFDEGFSRSLQVSFFVVAVFCLYIGVLVGVPSFYQFLGGVEDDCFWTVRC